SSDTNDSENVGKGSIHDGDTLPAGDRGRAMRARRATADDDGVVVATHVGSPSPACSCTMYAAYQSGQFASAWPVRFSCSPCAAAARRSAAATSSIEEYVVVLGSTRPGSRVVTSCSSQVLPSGSRNVAREK